jgi:hypothetical protein
VSFPATFARLVVAYRVNHPCRISSASAGYAAERAIFAWSARVSSFGANLLSGISPVAFPDRRSSCVNSA